MAELLFEIFSEEIPARMQDRAGQDLVRLMDKALSDAGLSPYDSRALTGPRRLTYVTDVETRSPDVSEDRKGPRVGSPERAVAGFMRGARLTDISQAEIRTDKKGEFYVAVIQKDGRDTADILKDVIPTLMADFPWPKSMKSGASAFRWVRPLRGLTVLLDGNGLTDIEVGDIQSDAYIYGHRQMGPGPFTVSSLSDYKSILTHEGHVMIDRVNRREAVLQQARAVCSDAGLDLVEDEGLLDEVTGLVEWPVALLGDMDPIFLELPEEVIRLTLKSHQKTFTVRGSDGKLAPHFVIIANLETPEGGETIKAGNAKVISARLADARFFQEEDRKRKLEDYYDQLDNVVFHKKLGSVRDKAERVAALAYEIAPHVGADPDVAERAARLAKCDLVTQSVIEFTSLQGKIGRWMYEHDLRLGRLDHPSSLTSGSDDGSTVDVDANGSLSASDHAAIATAIEDHYKPQGPSDAVPTEPVAVAVALADKMDTLLGFWAIDEKPTGSKDPYALRRAMLGAMRILIENNKSIDFEKTAIRHVLRLYLTLLTKQQSSIVIDVSKLIESMDSDHIVVKSVLDFQDRISKTVTVDAEKYILPLGIDLTADQLHNLARQLVEDIDEFSDDRLKIVFRNSGHKHDVIDAVITSGGDPLQLQERVEALGEFLSNIDGEDLVQGYKRAANILRAEEKKGELALASFETLSAFTTNEGAALHVALSNTRPAIQSALDSADYPAALSALADLRDPIDAFFENVVVNSDDSDERARRLALLSAIVETFHQIADFSRLDG